MKIGSIVAAILLSISASNALAAGQVTLRLGDVKGDRFVALKASGQLDNLPYQLKLSSFDSGAPVQEALNAGALDVGFTGDLPFLFVYAAGAPVKAVGAWQNNPDSIALLTRPDSGIKQLSDLKGKQIAVNRGGWGHYLILGLLERAGLTQKDVTLRFLGPVDGRAALASGAVDAWAPWEPYIATSIQVDGSQRVPQGGGKGIMSGYSYALAREEAINDPAKRAAISDLLARLAKAQIWARQHPQQFAATLGKSLKMPTAITEKWIADAQIRPVNFDQRLEVTLQKSADFFLKYQVLPKAVDVSQAFDYSLAGAANQVAKQQPGATTP
ncbi:sulfonate transport system substrate-binding protein [Erwinia toletana]|uniref:Sulfonate transport system substrate-binding protein n=1 Tax=Winslowiella toletana TaxID=92490 RepID=A0ABS4P548_9GAMM|nr:ABC transporter substrate-binding protein [Winslowiella toletana]MBP2167766.1 sulfonate transport system substrate-binding protein [Winslowiella toletana]